VLLRDATSFDQRTIDNPRLRQSNEGEFSLFEIRLETFDS
jgi:hypothetical protein